MSKLTDELIEQWMKAEDHFEMRGDGVKSGLYLSYRRGDGAAPAWLFRFRERGEQHKLRIGRYPDLLTADARALVSSYRKMIESGESVIAAIGNRRVGETGKELAKTFSALLREASLHGAKRMTVTIEFEGGESWAS
ncbi:MAG: Arm DNA-binding domain-containing protein [Rhodocyclaceae bacterium]|nr:Arm DNA-binding domain-containing protein [Rhodocyclaceae bacterium]